MPWPHRFSFLRAVNTRRVANRSGGACQHWQDARDKRSPGSYQQHPLAGRDADSVAAEQGMGPSWTQDVQQCEYRDRGTPCGDPPPTDTCGDRRRYGQDYDTRRHGIGNFRTGSRLQCDTCRTQSKTGRRNQRAGPGVGPQGLLFLFPPHYSLDSSGESAVLPSGLSVGRRWRLRASPAAASPTITASSTSFPGPSSRLSQGGRLRSDSQDRGSTSRVR